jgi:hypothetical protein
MLVVSEAIYSFLHYPIGSSAAGSLLGAAKRAKSALFPATADWRGGYRAGSRPRASRANRNVAQGALHIFFNTKNAFLSCSLLRPGVWWKKALRRKSTFRQHFPK